MESKCPFCGAEYDVQPSEVGKTVQCASCNTEFVVAAKPSPAIKRIVVPTHGRNPSPVRGPSPAGGNGAAVRPAAAPAQVVAAPTQPAAAPTQVVVMPPQPAAVPQTVVVPPQGGGRRFVHSDVGFMTPVLLAILQYLGYVGVAVYAGIQIFFLVQNMYTWDPKYMFNLAMIFIGVIVGCLVVRLLYESMVAIFEIVKHLREIRNRLEERA